MKAILEFSLPEEQDEFQTAVDAGKWKAVMWDLDNWLRQYTKYGDPKDVDAQNCRDKIYELLNERNLEL
jgi:hypothetical protein